VDIMLKRKMLLAAITAATLGAIPLQAPAAVDFYVDVAPPAPRYEVVPAPRHGYVWAPGYWDWRRGHYVWVRGHWEREHRGMYWHPDRWVQRDGHWVREHGGWHRERWEGERVARRARDHDGVPDRYDPAPRNPYVR